MSRTFAHSLPGHDLSQWEPLEEHLNAVAKLAGQYAAAFGAAAWGEILGLWHDLGKYSKEFQDYIRQSGKSDPNASEESSGQGRVDHSTFGAQHAARTIGRHFGQMLAFCIAGHHAGLPDAAATDDQGQRSSLRERLKAGPPRVPSVSLPPGFPPPPPLKLPFKPDPEHIAFQVAFFTRMLFSCLIDADRTATEAFCDKERSRARQSPKPSLESLCRVLEKHLNTKAEGAKATTVNAARAGVLSDCRAAAALPPGFFSLNVPTGGGKTLSSLAFALRHAVAHNLRRVVVAIPFTSIIEQTADVYRQALEPLEKTGLVEHHSNITPARDTRQNQMAAENWDAPVIVTTNVQLYESLFAARTTPCRKIHRLARSVIVLDEAQTMPVELLRPTLMALKELVAHYGCTVVLCTATQPALEWKEAEFDIGLKNITPIVRDGQALFQTLKRVTVESLGKLTDDALVEKLAAEPAALCVVNTRPHAAKLFQALVARVGQEGCYHLSTLMCPQHRRETLAEIRPRLKNHQTCRVISTQLIEAGVDVDFPAVYRAPAGFDSIAQAAGRCNREGSLPVGRVYLFESETPPPPGLLRSAAQCGRELAGLHPDPLHPSAVHAYFEHFYWQQKEATDRWDKQRVLETLETDLQRPELNFQFRTAGDRYKIIRDEQTSILVPYDQHAKALITKFNSTGEADYQELRDAQRYLIGVRDHDLVKLKNNHVVLEHPSGLYLLAEKAYDQRVGLSANAHGLDVDFLIQ